MGKLGCLPFGDRWHTSVFIRLQYLSFTLRSSHNPATVCLFIAHFKALVSILCVWQKLFCFSPLIQTSTSSPTPSSPFSPIKDCLVSLEMNSSVLDYANIYLLAFFTPPLISVLISLHFNTGSSFCLWKLDGGKSLQYYNWQKHFR